MKQNNLKNKKIIKKAKPSIKGAVLRFSKENPKQTKQISTYVIPVKTGIQPKIGVDSRFRGNDRGASGNDRGIKKTNFRNWNFNIVSNFALRASNLKHWHKISAVFVSIAVIGIAVFFQFAPEKARSKTLDA